MFDFLKKNIGEPLYNLDIYLDISEKLITKERAEAKTVHPGDILLAIGKAEENGFYTGFTVTDKGYLIIGKDSSLETKELTILIKSMEDIWALMEKSVFFEQYKAEVMVRYIPRLEIKIEDKNFQIIRKGNYLCLNCIN